jgi:hypothetical protein
VERLSFTHEHGNRRPTQSRSKTPRACIFTYSNRLPDQWYGYKLQDILELSGRDYMTLWVPSETSSWLVQTLRGRFRRGNDLFN